MSGLALALSGCMAGPARNPAAGPQVSLALGDGAALASVPGALPPPTAIQDEPAARPSEGWSFVASAYMWLASKRGVITLDNVGIPLDDPDESTGLFLYLEAERGRWGVLADLDLLTSEDETDIVTGTVAVDEDTLIGELDATYRLGDDSSLQFLLGLRVLDSAQDISFPVLPDQSTDTTQIDPVIGAQGTWPLGERFQFRLRGDVGGFGIDSDLTYQMFGVFAWEFVRHWGLTAGYRMVGWEFESDGVDNDLRLSGLLLGLAASF
jgi:hypothetical protein